MSLIIFNSWKDVIVLLAWHLWGISVVNSVALKFDIIIALLNE